MANLRLPMLTLNLLRSHQHLVSPTWSQNHDLPRTAKDFPNVSAPSAKRGDSVKFARSYAPRSVERLVEMPCVFKQISHISHIGHVPLVERLVEDGCESKHRRR